MHHTEHNWLSILDVFLLQQQQSCSADAVGSNMQGQQQHLRSSWWAVMSDISNAEGEDTESE